MGVALSRKHCLSSLPQQPQGATPALLDRQCPGRCRVPRGKTGIRTQGCLNLRCTSKPDVAKWQSG